MTDYEKILRAWGPVQTTRTLLLRLEQEVQQIEFWYHSDTKTWLYNLNGQGYNPNYKESRDETIRTFRECLMKACLEVIEKAQ